MRLHRLRLSAIGPFRDQVEIDFSRLGASGLFLLEGPTGSGKSTIIDAISFALYGRVAQVSATGERLRSHHADPSVEPVVELVFETQNGIFRVRRTPSFDRPKRDGSGSRKVQGSVKIWRVSSPDNLAGGEPLSTRVAEADDEILRAVGLSHAQFVQTMVLPQGEFANFLRSKTDDKRILLQKLFGTELIEQVQQQLIEAKRAAETRRAQTASAIGQAAHALATAASLDAEQSATLGSAADRGDDDDVQAQVERATTQFTARQAAAIELSQHRKATRTAAQARVADALERNRRRERRQTLRARQSALQAQLERVAAVRSRVELGERALAPMAPARALATAVERSDHLQTSAEQAQRELSAGFADADEAALRAAERALQITIGQLAGVREVEEQHARRHLELAALDEQAAQLSTAVDAARAALTEFPGRRADVVATLAEATQAAVAETSLVAERARAVSRLRAAKQAAAAEVAAARDQQVTQAALTAYETQQLRFDALQVSWRASVAGALGQELSAGDPCAVCGSVEHPRPAALRADHVSQDVLDSAQHEVGRLRRAVESAREELAHTRSELADLRAFADQLNPDQAQAKVRDVERALAQAQTAGARQRELERELAELGQSERLLREQSHEADLQRAGFQEQAQALRAELDAQTQTLSLARDGHPSVGDRIATLQSQAQNFERAATVCGEAARALAHARECGTQFQKAISEAGFLDEAEWLSARLEPSEISRSRAEAREFDDEWAAVLSALAEPELADTALDAPAQDVEPLQAALAQAETAEGDAIAAHAVAQSELKAVRRQSLALRAAMTAGAKLLAETAAAIRIGAVAAGGGDNQLSMELTTYVLTRRFADIMGAANAQLRQISGGRYELEHSEAKQGNAKSGLGMRVMDLHTGRARDPATLSGGETFYVSLSLALGLADVVRAESGGVDLGTLFIDEGFGTLDAGVLDEVLRVLDSLRAGGRAVGVVSHVAEMKARIAEQIVIRPNPDGTSTLRLIA